MTLVRIAKLQAVFVGIESVEGTDPTLAAHTALQLVEPAEIVFAAGQKNDRPMIGNGLIDQVQPLAPRGKECIIRGRCYLRGYGAAYDNSSKHPELNAVIQGAGFAEVQSLSGGSESYTFDSASVSTKTLSAYGFQGLETNVWVKHALVAGRTQSLTFSKVAGQPGVVSFEIRGIYVAPADGSPTTPTYQTSLAAPWGGASALTYGSYTGKARSIELTITNALEARPDGNTADSLAGFVITSRTMGFNMLLEAQRIADFDPNTLFAAATAQALAVRCPGGASGGTQYNRVLFDADKATIFDEPGYENVNGIWCHRLRGIISIEGTNRLKITYN